MKNNTFKQSTRIICLMLAMFVGIKLQSQNISSYTFSASSGTFTQLTSGTIKALTGGGLDDGYYGGIPLGFNFNYGGTNYNSISACTNGWISFVSSMTLTSEINDLTAGLSGARPIIAPLWDDLYMSTGAFKYFADTIGGTDSVFTAEWLNVRWFYSVATPVISIQVKLFKNNGRIQFIYRQDSTPVSGASASIGLMGTSLGSGNFISLSINSNPASPGTSTTVETATNNIRPATGQIYQFDRPPVCAGTPVGGTASAFNPSVCKSSTAISLIGASGGVGIMYQWQDSTSGVAWAPASGGSGSTTATFTSPVLYAPRFYRCLITCSNSSLSSYSTVATISMGCLNYDVTRSTGIIYNSIISSGNTFTWNILSADDGGSDAVMLTPAQFSFTYAGQQLSGFRVCTNGWMTLDVLNTSKEYHNDFATLAYPKVFAPLWDDLVVTGNNQTNLTNIRYQIVGSTVGSRVLVVEWYGMEIYYNPGPDLNFQVKLYEGSNNIEFIYGKMQGFDGTNNYTYSYTSGITSASVGSPILSGQVLTQKSYNTRNFDSTSTNNHSVVPHCNSSILYSPGTYTTYIPPSVLTPVNDSAGAPIILTVNASPCTDLCGSYYSSANATGSSQVPTCTGIPDDDVWFRFTAPTGGQVTVTVRGAGGYDPVFQVMNSSYDTAGMGVARCRNLTGDGFTETANITGLITSNNYFIRVYNSTTGSGTDGYFSVCVNQYIVPPANDECSASTLIPMSNSTCTPTSGSTLAATPSSQLTCAGISDDDVWYSFGALGNKSRILVQSGAGFNAHVEIFSGTCGTLASIRCINNTSTGGMETDSFTTAPANIYYVRVYHTGTGAGTGNFTICAFNVSPPTNQATSVTPSNTTTTSTQISWTNGNGLSRLVVALPTFSIAVPPSNYTTYTANTVFGSGSQIAVGSNNYVVYDGTGSTVTITGLSISTQYSFYVYEYNGTATAKTYLIPGASTYTTTLPVKLVSFTGIKENSNAVLSWQTASELNNEGFEIERSSSGQLFNKIGFVKGSGTINKFKNYAYTDIDAFAQNEVAYYRLKQIDFDGKFNYSSVILVNDFKGVFDQISAIPNPFNSTFAIRMISNYKIDAEIVITDIQGKTVFMKKVELEKGLNDIILPETAVFEPGVFFIKVSYAGETTMLKLLKM